MLVTKAVVHGFERNTFQCLYQRYVIYIPITGNYMFLFIEDRLDVVIGYQAAFSQRGIDSIFLKSSEIDNWVSANPNAKQHSISTCYLSESNVSEKTIDCIHNMIDAPIIALLENRLLTSLIDFYRHGVDEVVVKPTNMDELVDQFFMVQSDNFVS